MYREVFYPKKIFRWSYIRKRPTSILLKNSLRDAFYPKEPRQNDACVVFYPKITFDRFSYEEAYQIDVVLKIYLERLFSKLS